MVISNVLQSEGITQLITEMESETLNTITPEILVLSRGWAKNPGNTKFELNVAYIKKTCRIV